MRIKKYRYFFIFMTAQENWLNKMASNGYRLINTTKLAYEFETCDRDKYEYCIEFIGNKSYNDLVNYKSFIEQMGYKTFIKNININYSYGKVHWRPTGKGIGQLATSPGGYNKELLIIEKSKDGKPFNIYSNYKDLINYYIPLRNICITYLVLDLLLLFYCISNISNIPFNLFLIVILIFIATFTTLQIGIYTTKINTYKKLNKINE